ncbi:MAG: hypothetical protein ACU4EQ_13365 [Candidatus Nitrosoglobus sp.]
MRRIKHDANHGDRQELRRGLSSATLLCTAAELVHTAWVRIPI